MLECLTLTTKHLASLTITNRHHLDPFTMSKPQEPDSRSKHVPKLSEKIRLMAEPERDKVTLTALKAKKRCPETSGESEEEEDHDEHSSDIQIVAPKKKKHRKAAEDVTEDEADDIQIVAPKKKPCQIAIEDPE